MTPSLLSADWNYWPEERSADHTWAFSKAIGFDRLELGVAPAAIGNTGARARSAR